MTPALLATALLFGLASGFHCLAMCGGFVGALSARATTAPLLPARTLMRQQLATHAGRLTTYALLGAVAGTAGGALLGNAWLLPLQRTLYALANALILWLALALVLPLSGVATPGGMGLWLFRHVVARVPGVRAGGATRNRYLIGLAWGLVPCASIYAMLPVALFAGSGGGGAAVMLAFGIGTLPQLVGAGALLHRMPALAHRRGWRAVAAMMLAGIGVAGLWHAGVAADGLTRGLFCVVH
ncbi:MAG: sulfite exporter TauE/SafE family protein [Proteobacteria bacterium]|nr:sulfite exporter TauE/SafE family protein [Pseudomonadota bacterium]